MARSAERAKSKAMEPTFTPALTDTYRTGRPPFGGCRSLAAEHSGTRKDLCSNPVTPFLDGEDLSTHGPFERE
ncbi:MAG TPA: hypothetical protein VHR47_03250 [Bacillota bacterium]|nr:hypothetical protein [Bacillota bacterium]